LGEEKCTPREKILGTRMRKGAPPYVGMGPRTVIPAPFIGPKIWVVFWATPVHGDTFMMQLTNDATTTVLLHLPLALSTA